MRNKSKSASYYWYNMFLYSGQEFMFLQIRQLNSPWTLHHKDTLAASISFIILLFINQLHCFRLFQTFTSKNEDSLGLINTFRDYLWSCPRFFQRKQTHSEWSFSRCFSFCFFIFLQPTKIHGDWQFVESIYSQFILKRQLHIFEMLTTNKD